MEITYDEYIATWQAPEAKQSLDNRINDDSRKRYDARMMGAGSNPESTRQLAEMSPNAYRSLRMYQMGQLLEAYRKTRSGDPKGFMWIGPYTTDPNQIRRVVGDKAGYMYNNDILALDSETIGAVYHVAEMRDSLVDYSMGKEWTSALTPYGLEKIVDEMIACKGILTENMQIDSSEAQNIYRETDIAKRAIGKAQYRSYNEMDQMVYREQVGKNSFGIKDYELSWQQLIGRKSKAWTKTGGKLLKYLDEKINPDAERNNPNRIGNRTVEVPKEFTGGER